MRSSWGTRPPLQQHWAGDTISRHGGHFLSHLTAVLLGPPRLERDGRTVQVGTRKAIALLAYLVLTQRHHSRDSLAALLWPDYDQVHARGALRSTLYDLKKTLRGPGLHITREEVGFEGDENLAFDVVEFQRCLDECHTHGHPPEAVCSACLDLLAQAADLYGDDLMSGFNAGAGPEYEQWQLFQTEALRRKLGDALERLARGHRDRGEFERAIFYARRWQSLDPLEESANRRLMQVYALAGQRVAALQQYQELVERLRRELDVEPQAETTALYLELRKDQAPASPPRPAAGNLAAHIPSTPFVGREEELARLSGWLNDPEARLLTLVGAGGIGKTRLALHSALVHGDQFSHGAYFVPLAPVRAGLLVSAIAQELDLIFLGRRDPRMQLLDHLREKHMLLVLDNIEHLRDQAALLADILKEAPRVKLLVTSREWLNLPQEVVLDVQGLPFPGADRAAGMTLEDYGAVQLFAQNARRVHWSFILRSEEDGVERICRLVEGMPLGIELAAAWVRVISCDEIAREIERDLGFLSTTLGGLPERHRSLRVVFDYSYHRLGGEVKRAFRQMSLFRGGFSRDAAGRVAGASLPVLTTLVDHSLLHRAASGRYEMHELLRQYGEEQLHAMPGEEVQTREAHSGYYAEFLQTRLQQLTGERQREALEAIAVEVDNVRAAWQRAVTARRFEDIAKSFESLFLFWRVRSLFSEGAESFGRAAEALGGTPHDILRAGLLARRATFLELLGQFDEARALLRTSLGLLPRDAPGTNRARAYALVESGTVAVRLGELVEARAVLEEALALYRAEHDTAGIANALRWLGQIASDLDGDYRSTRNIYRECLELYRKAGDRRGVAGMLNNLSMVAGDLGEYDEAKRLLRESIAAHKELGNRYGVALALNNLGVVMRNEGDYQEAWRIFEESLAIRREVGDRFAIALVLANLGKTATCLGNYEQARQLLDSSLALHNEVGDRIGIANTLAKQGVLAARSGEPQKAKGYFLEALKITLESKALSTHMQILSETAAFMAHSDSSAPTGVERAVSLAAFVLGHPASDHVTREAVSRLLAELEERMRPEVMAAARERAREIKLEEVAGQLLLTDQWQ
jgi:predicted ATPase/DNA-binding SARP family transcriptional activator